MIALSPPEMTGQEGELVADCLRSGRIGPGGPHVDAFELELAERCARKYAIATSSGTAALQLALRVLDTQPGDEVWVATFTFVATANVVRYMGATPVFIDCDETWCLDPVLLSDALAEASARGCRPHAVIAVDNYGRCCDWDALEAACARHGVWLIEDAACALGSTYKGRPAGSFGKVSALSFNANKIITCGGGGALLVDYGGHESQAHSIAAQSHSKERRYLHTSIGHNFGMTNVAAAIGRAQLRDLDRRIARRREHAAAYRSAMDGFPFQPLDDGANAWLTCCEVEHRDAIIAQLSDYDIETRPGWWPMHRQPMARGCRIIGGAVSTRLADRVLCLPSAASLRIAQRDFVVNRFTAAYLAAGNAC